MSTFVRTETYLDRILAHKVEEIAARQQAASLDVVKAAAEAPPPARDFVGALRSTPNMALIAEVKHASPSKGVLIEDFDPVRLGKLYAANGAAAISVLADEKFFQGGLGDMQAVRGAVEVPVLCKEFIIEAYQVYEARQHGADAVLLIAAALEDSQMADLYALIRVLGMAPLIEVHNAAEMERALRLDPPLVGVNNRDLKTFEVDIHLTRRLAALVPPQIMLVAESGIKQAEDVAAMARAGAQAVLVGEGLIAAPDTAAAVRAFAEQPHGVRL